MPNIIQNFASNILNPIMEENVSFTIGEPDEERPIMEQTTIIYKDLSSGIIKKIKLNKLIDLDCGCDISQHTDIGRSCEYCGARICIRCERSCCKCGTFCCTEHSKIIDGLIFCKRHWLWAKIKNIFGKNNGEIMRQHTSFPVSSNGYADYRANVQQAFQKDRLRRNKYDY